MRPITLLAFGFLWICNPDQAQGQIWKNMGKKIEKKVEDQASRRLERKIDQAIDKGFDSVENAADEAVRSDNKPKSEDTKAGGESAQPSQATGASSTTTTDTPSADAIYKALGIQNSANAAPLTGTYDFKVGVTYETTVSSQKSKEKNPGFTLWISENPYMGMATDANNSMFMVMDGEKMITFMEQNKTYMVLGGAMFQGAVAAAAEEAENDSNPSDFSISKVGTEKILGYDCDVYEMKSDETVATVWLTNALGVSPGSAFMSSFSTLMKNNKTQLPSNFNQAAGVMLKMESKNTKDQEEISLVATQISQNGKSIDASQYKSMGF